MSTRRYILLGGGAVAAAAAVAGAFTFLGTGGSEATADDSPASTADIERRDMARTEDFDGTLSYGTVYELAGLLQGTVTDMAEAGTVLEPGTAAYFVNNEPVVVMQGELPMWRDLVPGTEGPDVQQLERFLSENGYENRFTADDSYTWATAAAVEDWQADIGMAETGTVPLGSVVFLPHTMRVAERIASVGDPSNGPILGYTRNQRSVTLELEVSDQDLAEEEMAVTVTLPDGTEVDGEVTDVSTTVSGGGSDEVASGEEEPTTIEVTVTVDDGPLGDLESAPVTVELTRDVHEDVLAVPVEALLALREGGYGLEIADGGETTIVPVDTGFFERGLVEVEGDGLDEGMSVVVPE
ncbi:peptidoglycan-binding protein [Glycomyces xiaoerkulensis]|uniref:peptidoglycan-binding protein n=1 Tax=Glycomyces xiaoerkulensis TaxID=2038139 RepID=UPI000C2652BB|nr:peptidoglycan-binding protein [Glycomyces xiaoerkulensis]